MNLIDQKLFKFLAVGIVNTILGAGVMFLLYNVFEVSYWISSACNYIVGGIVSFFLNKSFTFKNHKKSLKQVVLFIITLAVCYFVAYIAAKKIIYFIFSTSPEKIKGNIALICGMCIYTGLNYIGQRLIVFSEENEKLEEKI
ncbi:MAG: GtrA family protein [Treponema sp.]|nr:GtrA family protein [Treponema sp.]